MAEIEKKNVYLQASQMVAEARKRHSSCIVSFSGGKDSFVILDLIAKAGFTQIVLYHRCFLPGLKVVDKYIDYAKQRYKVECLEYIDPMLITYLKSGMYNDVGAAVDRLQDWDNLSMKSLVRADTGISLVATGSKRTDAMGQGLANAKWANGTPDDLQPIIDWNKYHVYSYLKANDIPLPESDGRNSSSMDLDPVNLIWLYDKHPEDFRRIQKVFPYVEAVIWRKKWYGIPA